MVDRSKARRLKFNEANALAISLVIVIAKVEAPIIDKEPKPMGRPRTYPLYV